MQTTDLVLKEATNWYNPKYFQTRKKTTKIKSHFLQITIQEFAQGSLHSASPLTVRSDKGLALAMSAFESPYGGQFTLSTHLMKPNYPVILLPTQHPYLFAMRLCIILHDICFQGAKCGKKAFFHEKLLTCI